MIKRYLKVASRNIVRHKGYSFINFSGLAIGMAVCLLLFLWIQDESSYDRYHENADQIYRVAVEYVSNGSAKRSASTPAPLGPALTADFPEVKKAVRFGMNGFLVCMGNKCFYERVFFADPGIFDVFSFPLAQNCPGTSLDAPHSIVISRKIKEKYFGQEDPVGKTINLRDLGDFRITGVFKNVPGNSHFRFDFLGNFSDYAGRNLDQWGNSNFYTYIMIAKDVPLDKFKEKLPQFVEKYRGKEAVSVYKTRYLLQPLTQIHLHSQLRNEIQPNGDIRNIYLFAAIALFILFIACVNYINLTAAMNVKRIKEIGLRKVFGASRVQLINQFLCEALVFSLIALPTALVIGQLLLPFFNSIVGKQLKMTGFDNLFLLAGLVCAFLAVGLVSGFFPAFFVSRLQPVIALKRIIKPNVKVSSLRKVLVVFQFTLAMIFIINTIGILNQLDYMAKKDTGFDMGNIITIPIYRKSALQKYETIKNEFLKNSHVQSVSASSFSPGNNHWYVNYWREGGESDGNPMTSCIIVDDSFVETFGIKLVKGRSFSKNFPGDREHSYIINESAAKEFGWESPIGKKFQLGFGKKGTVIGVVEDFHFRSLHHQVKPVVLYFSPRSFAYFSIKLSPQDISSTLDYLKNKWEELIPGQMFEYSFFSEDYENLYESEVKLGRLFIVVTIFALFIACLGLYGLMVFALEQRTREVGTRKVLGASTARIFLLLSSEFNACILAANILAWPIAWYTVSRWMQNFAYRPGIGIWTFLVAGLSVYFIAFLTLGYKSFRTASVNPVKVLRYE